MDLKKAGITGRAFESPYIVWAKTRSNGRFNLATSGVPGVPLAELGATIEDLEINGPGGYGYQPLREAISDEYAVPTESVVMAAGASGANYCAFSLLLGPGDEALVEHPAYDVLTNLALFTGATLTRFHRRPENDWAIDLDEIADRITPRTKLIVLTNLHNPSGQFADELTLTRIAELAAAKGAYVLVDEAYLDCVWDQTPRSAFHLGPNIIVTSSLTKVYGLSGLRCGWIFAPPDIAERLWRLSDLFDSLPSHPAELLSVIAFRQLDRLRGLARSLMETNRALYGSTAPKYGTVAFPRVSGIAADALCDLLRERHETTVVPGRFFEMSDRIRISLVAQPDILREGLARIERALHDAGARLLPFG
jgi:aspartate/methionine/tyrosine aminotransferase